MEFFEYLMFKSNPTAIAITYSPYCMYVESTLNVHTLLDVIASRRLLVLFTFFSLLFYQINLTTGPGR